MSVHHYIDFGGMTGEAEVSVANDPAPGPWETAARGGERGQGTVVVSDPTGVLDLKGWRPYRVEETLATARPDIFRGFILGKEIGRGNEGPFGPGCQWRCTIEDGNLLLRTKLLRGGDCKRPAETNLQRIAWLLAKIQGYGVPIYDTGFVADSHPRPFDAADYHYEYAEDVLDDISGVIGRDYWIFWDYDAACWSLFYNARDATVLDSGYTISNFEGEADFDTILPTGGAAENGEARDDAKISRQPDETYSGGVGKYRTGVVYVRRPAVAAAYIDREILIDSSRNIGQATALAAMNSYLDTHSTEKDTVTVPVRLEASKVNDILAGDLLRLHLEHLPGYRGADPVASRVARRKIDRLGVDDAYDALYTCTLAAPAARGGGPPSSDFPHPPPSAPIIVQSKFDQIDLSGNITLDAAPTAGNWLIIGVSSRGTSITLPGAFTEHPHGQITPGGDFGRMGYRVVDVGEAAAVRVSTAGGRWAQVWEVSGIDGTLDTSSFADVDTFVQPATINGGTLTPTSGVPVAMFLLLVQHNSDWTGNGATTMSTPTGWTQSGEYEVTVNGDLHPNVQADYRIESPATGSYGTSSTIAGAGFNYGGWGGLALAFAGSAVDTPPDSGQEIPWQVPTFVADGEPYTWRLPVAFADGTLEIRLDGNAQTWTSYDGACGEFTVPFQVLPGERLEARALGL